MQEINIQKNDVLKQMYFVLSLVQNANGPMHSRVGSKNDYMGGILDRYVNTVVESLIFSKLLFPKINTTKKIDLIRDFYSYEPGTATIAPDLFGIVVNGKAIPFTIYNEGWKPVDGCPQVEIKTLKKNQRMLSLVNQHYDEKYLILAESNYQIDYLMPFINTDLFNDKLYNEIMNDIQSYNDQIIISDTNGYITPMKKVSFENDSLGKLNIIVVTKTKDFIEASNVAGKGITPECIETKELVKTQKEESVPMTNYCYELKDNFYRFNDEWYSLTNKQGVIYRPKKVKITLDFYCPNISAIEFVKMNKSNFYIRVKEEVILNNETLQPGDYRINLFSGFDRSDTTNEEYFIDKAVYHRIANCENELLGELKKIIDAN